MLFLRLTYPQHRNITRHHTQQINTRRHMSQHMPRTISCTSKVDAKDDQLHRQGGCRGRSAAPARSMPRLSKGMVGHASCRRPEEGTTKTTSTLGNNTSTQAEDDRLHQQDRHDTPCIQWGGKTPRHIEGLSLDTVCKATCSLLSSSTP